MLLGRPIATSRPKPITSGYELRALRLSNTKRRVMQEFTPETHLAIISARRGRSSAGRASRSQCEGRGFDPLRLHHMNFQGRPVKSDGLFFCGVRLCVGSRRQWPSVGVPGTLGAGQALTRSTVGTEMSDSAPPEDASPTDQPPSSLTSGSHDFLSSGGTCSNRAKALLRDASNDWVSPASRCANARTSVAKESLERRRIM